MNIQGLRENFEGTQRFRTFLPKIVSANAILAYHCRKLFFDDYNKTIDLTPFIESLLERFCDGGGHFEHMNGFRRSFLKEICAKEIGNIRKIVRSRPSKS